MATSRGRHAPANADEFFTDAQPLGPDATPQDFNEAAYHSLFDRSNLLYAKLNVDELDGPIIVVGRRGSGKTAFLKSTHFLHPSSIVVEFVPNKIFGEVVRSINQLAAGGSAFVEDVRDIWNYLFWITAFYEVHVRYSSLPDPAIQKIGSFLQAAGIKPRSQIYGILAQVLKLLERRYHAEGTVDLLESAVRARGLRFEEVRDELQAFLVKRDLRIFFLLDNLEDFELDREQMSKAVSGLIKCVAEFRQVRDRHHLRWCVPAELYFQIVSMSKNPLKDFSQQLLLHWHAGELLQLAANRYAAYLRLRETDFFRRKVEGLVLRDRRDVKEFWRLVLPDAITNGFGRLEDPIAYILRHTQLLPRQMVRYLNSVISLNVKDFGSRFRIDPHSITTGVREVEGTVAREVCTAFGATYPRAYEACSATLPNLPYVFREGDLRKAFNQHGKKTKATDTFEEFRQMMVEIGAIGVVTAETEYYHIGRFEYTEPYKLSTSADDTLCLHPIFFRTFRATVDKTWKPVYPFGSDPESPDLRIGG
jgi:hypothetical protein